MTTQIFFCGEIVADLIEQNQGSGDLKLILGGSQFYGVRGAKRAIDREGVDATAGFVGPISTDMLGDRFVKVLEDEKIDLSGVKRVDRNTTLAIVSIAPGKENGFCFYSSNGADQMTTLDDLPLDLGDKVDNKIWCFGSISTVMEPARFAWLAFAKKKSEDGLVIYDLNTRPSIAKDPVRYRELVLEWAKVAHVMKASDADIGWAYPGMSLEDVAKIWLDAGATMAVITKGMHGSEAFTHKITASATTLDLVATNTVGAGDNFNSGLTVFLAKNKVFSGDALNALDEVRLASIVQGANHTAAYHLVAMGAKPREAKRN